MAKKKKVVKSSKGKILYGKAAKARAKHLGIPLSEIITKKSQRTTATASKPAKKKKGGGKKPKATKKKPQAASKPRASKKKGGGGKKGKKKAKKRPATQVGRKAYTAAQKFDREMARLKRELEAANKRADAAKNAKGAHKAKRIAQLEKEKERINQKVARLQAAEEERKKRSKSRKGKGKRKKKNPISGMGETAAAIGGVVTSAIVVVGGYRWATTHKIAPVGQQGAQGGASTYYDAAGIDSKGNAALGQVYNINAPNLPVWADMKRTWWKKLIVLVVGVPVPMVAAHVAGRYGHHKTQTYFHAIALASGTLIGGKLVVDGGSAILGKTGPGQRLLAPENTAKSLRKAAAANPLPTVIVSPDLGIAPQLTGYGAGASPEQIAAAVQAEVQKQLAAASGTRTPGAGKCSGCGCQMSLGSCGDKCGQCQSRPLGGGTTPAVMATQMPEAPARPAPAPIGRSEQAQGGGTLAGPRPVGVAGSARRFRNDGPKDGLPSVARIRAIR